MEGASFQKLKEYLATLPEGHVPISRIPEVVNLLAQCWDSFGKDDERMYSHKLQRLEELEWRPPILRFIIERHGALMMGSSRAELQEWVVNIDLKQAYCHPAGYRQISPRSPRLDVNPIADELTQLIISGSEDERLKWAKTGRVRILSGVALPWGPQKTMEGRRVRLNAALSERLEPHGWRSLNMGWWEKSK